jgi:uncharacterized protein (DUF302 family)
MQNPMVALDLPLKLLIFEDDQSQTWITCNDASYIGDRYKLEQNIYLPLALDKIIQRALA